MSSNFLWSYTFRDLRRNKMRSFLGVFGVGICIFLLSLVSFITDTVSSNFVQFLTIDAGGQDLVLMTRNYYGQPSNRSAFFNFNETRAQIEANVSEFSAYLPRSLHSVASNGRPTHPVSTRYYFTLCAMDIALEERLKFGKFSELKDNFNLTDGLPRNSCLISTAKAQDLNLTNGNIIQIYAGDLGTWFNLTVASSFEQDLKFPTNQECDIVVDFTWWGNFSNQVKTTNKGFDWVGKSNRMILILNESQVHYDVRDIAGTTARISSIGEKVLNTVGIIEWQLDYPKLNNLGLSSFLTMGLQIIFVVIGIVAALISGILINAILSTSVEEKIREFGINSVLGARKTFSLQMIIIQSLVLCVSGSTLGISGAYFSLKYIVIPVITGLLPSDYSAFNIILTVQPTSVLISYAIGIGISLIVSIAPALKVMRLPIVQSINPYRHEDTMFKLKKRESVNLKIIIFGLIIALNGGLVFLLLPRILLSLDIGMIAGFFVVCLLVFLIGFSIFAIGIIPMMLRLLTSLFQPFAKKVMPLIKITVHRYQRRNMSTVVMFVLSFSFIMFTTSMVDMQINQVAGNLSYKHGSEIVLNSNQWGFNTPTIQMSSKIAQTPGVERMSVVTASPAHLRQIFSYSGTWGAKLGDYIDYQQYSISLWGIDENFVQTVLSETYLTFEEGDPDIAFPQLFEQNENISIIISTALSRTLNVHIGEKTRLTITKTNIDSILIATIVGVVDSVPGLSNFYTSEMLTENGGVLISNANYCEAFNLASENVYLEKVFIKMADGYSASDVVSNLKLNVGKSTPFNYIITQERIEKNTKNFQYIKYLFLLILIGTILIGLFGLIISAYSSILERSREISIIRTLGLRPKDVNVMFRIENLIILLASGLTGSIIGYITGYLLSYNIALLINNPFVNSFPWDIALIIFGFSIVVLIVGMKYLLRNLSKQNLLEIYRATA